MSRDLSGQIAGARAKSFLAAALYDLMEELSGCVEDWETRITRVVSSAARRSFTASEDMMLETQAKVFLRWLGFSPVDVWYSEDVKVGRIYLGTSRLWKGNLADISNEKLRALVQAIIKGMGQGFLGGETTVSILTDVDLPTRHTLCVQFSEKASVPTTGTLKKEELTLGTELVEPFLGKAVNPKLGLDSLIDAAINWLKEEDPESYQIYENDLAEVPLKVLYVAHKIAIDRNRLTEIPWRIGERFVEEIKNVTQDAAPHKLIKGLGLLPPEQITDLMFYGKSTALCQSENIQFAEFLTKIWEKYLGEILGKRFIAEKPMQAAGSGKLCLFSFTSSS
ncbi:MAG: hypothetical protein ACE5OZ_23090 [Candidatus Heimdallarchaeota archaeon]